MTDEPDDPASEAKPGSYLYRLPTGQVNLLFIIACPECKNLMTSSAHRLDSSTADELMVQVPFWVGKIPEFKAMLTTSDPLTCQDCIGKVSLGPLIR